MITDFLSRGATKEEYFDADHILDTYLLINEAREDLIATRGMVSEQMEDEIISAIRREHFGKRVNSEDGYLF